ncbi:MAG: M1 aminopeptidase family protein, partial [Planctomycetota bacterium]
RLMPFGFTVPRYGTLMETTPGGLEFELHHLPDHEDRAPRWLDVAVRAAGFFEETIGPLPWDRVAVCQVAPLRGGAGCSLPGQILFSEDLVGRDGELFVDEMSHQWNAYFAPLPNELCEGFASYSVALFLEREKGAKRYLRTISSYRSAYLLEVRHGGDRAVSDPGVYSTPAYRGIAFCKTAVGLHGLRKRLGDARFFAAWRRVFETVREPETAYEDVRHAFEYAAGEDLRAYFDGWLHRPGFPDIALEWRRARVEAGPGIEVVLTQTQDGPPFEIDLDVAVRTEGEGTVTREASMRKREQTFRWALPAWPAGAGLDPGGTALCRRARR